MTVEELAEILKTTRVIIAMCFTLLLTDTFFPVVGIFHRL